ncbi:hypothetical protein D3C81_1329960 [compost metagenome]
MTPVAYRQPRQKGRPQRRRFANRWTFYGHPENIALELHQESVRDGPSVHLHGPYGIPGVLLHRAKDIFRLVSQRLKRRSNEVLLLCSSRQAKYGPAYIAVPVRASEANECRNNIDAFR